MSETIEKLDLELDRNLTSGEQIGMLKNKVNELIGYINDVFKKQKQDKREHELEAKVMQLDWKNHGWTGSVDSMQSNREEWDDYRAIIKLVREHDKQSE